MEKIKIKILNWDAENAAWTVKFLADTDPDGFDGVPAYGVTPLTMFPGVTDLSEILKRLALSSLDQCRSKERMRQLKQNQNLMDTLGSVVGQEIEYTVSDLEQFMQQSNSGSPQHGLDVEEEDIFVC